MNFPIIRFWPLILISAIGFGTWRLAVNRRAEFISETTTITSVTLMPTVSAPAPKLDERGNIIHDWKAEHPDLVRFKPLKDGIWLRNTLPSRVSFSPDSRWLVGGQIGGRGAMLWDAQSGESKGIFGESLHPNKFIDFLEVSFLSNQKIALLMHHDVTIFDLNLLPAILPRRKPTYLSIGYCGPLSKRGVWTYTYDIYDENFIKDPSRVKRQLRFWDFENAKFTRVLSASLLYDNEYTVPIPIQQRNLWIAVKQTCEKIFVLNANYRVIWSEKLVSCAPYHYGSHSHGSTTQIDDFDLTSNNRLLLLDRDKGLRQINLKTRKEAKPYPLPERATKLAVSKSGKFWAFGDKSGRLMLVDVDKRELLANVILPFTTEYLTFSPDEKSIAVGGLVILPISNFTSPDKSK